MKRAYYILAMLFCSLISFSCAKEEGGIDPRSDGEFVFHVAVPDARIVHTRAEEIEAGMIENIYVLVFDQNGSFLSRKQAMPTGVTPGNYTVRLAPTDQDIPTADRKRRIHFVCNYDWSGFSDIRNLGKDENEIIPVLRVAGGKVAYWQRIELANGVTAGAFPGTIELIRNVARIFVVDNSALSGMSASLDEPFFAVGNALDTGTVAPFNTSTLTFDENQVSELPFSSLGTVEEADFKEAGTFFNQNRGVPIDCYERKNSTADDPLYVIVKGIYQTTEGPVETYYKIDILRPGEEQLLDICRNHYYRLEITYIAGLGSPTLQEAIHSPASNNLLYSVLFEKYPSISDGVALLNVGTMNKTFVEAGRDFRIDFSYFPLIAGPENNTTVDVSLVHVDPAKPVVDSYQVDKTAGSAHISGKTAGLVPQYDIYEGRFVLSASQYGVILHRVVELRLQAPAAFGSVFIDPTPALTTVGSPVNICFSIPERIRENNFPMEIFITVQNLSPNLTPGFDSKLTLDYQIPGRFRYRYIATKTGAHAIHFKTTASSINEAVLLESELFAPASVNLTTAGGG